jgi:hypothetical protein
MCAVAVDAGQGAGAKGPEREAEREIAFLLHKFLADPLIGHVHMSDG